MNEHNTEKVSGEQTTTTENVEEFQDFVYQRQIIEDYMEDYDDSSGEMSDEDYL